MDKTPAVEVLVAGYDAPEGPAFDRAGNLFFVNWTSSSIVRLTPGGAHAEWHNTGGIPAGLAFHSDGSLWVADEGAEIHGVLRIPPDRHVFVVADRHEGRPLNGANDLVFAPDGTLYFSDPWGSSAERPIGGFYRLPPGGALERLDGGLAFPNGVAVAPDGAAVYLAETVPNRVLRYPLGRDGAVGPREVFATLGGGPGPDGMAFDEAGNLYVAHWSGARVVILGPNGAEVGAIPIPGPNVTNVAFGGADRRTLVVTEVATASVYRTRVAVPGLRLYGDG